MNMFSIRGGLVYIQKHPLTRSLSLWDTYMHMDEIQKRCLFDRNFWIDNY